MRSIDASKLNNLSSFKLDLQVFKQGAGVVVVAKCAIASLYAYTWSTKWLKRDHNNSIILAIKQTQH